MITLYQHPICPFARLIRIILIEKNLPFELIQCNYNYQDPKLLAIDPLIQLPVLVYQDDTLSNIYAIIEYINEANQDSWLIDSDKSVKANIRKIFYWFNSNFYNQITKPILAERVIGYKLKAEAPNSNLLRQVKTNLLDHLDYIAHLLTNHRWLAREQLSLADIAAAAQLSVLDYFGDIPWNYNSYTKEWYALIKSRPSFRSILTDRVNGFIPMKHYENLDF